MPRVPIQNWYAQQLRITVFTAGTVDLKRDYGWWKLVTGEESESQALKARERVYEEVGSFLAGQLVLHVEPERIDWIMQPVSGGPEENNQPNFGPYLDVAKKFLAAVAPWHRSAPDATRIALGGVAVFPVANKLEGYKLIAEYLPSIKLDPIGSADFLYQINRPRNAPVGGVEVRINRVVRYSVSGARYLRVVAFSDGTKSELSDEVSALRFEVDINTNPEYKGPIGSSTFQSLLERMMSYTEEILQQGDIQ